MTDYDHITADTRPAPPKHPYLHRSMLGAPLTTTPQAPDPGTPARPTAWRCDCHGTRWLLTTLSRTPAIVSTPPADTERYATLGDLVAVHTPVRVCEVDNVASLWAEKAALELRLAVSEEHRRTLAAIVAAFPHARSAAALAHARDQRDQAMACAHHLETLLEECRGVKAEKP